MVNRVKIEKIVDAFGDYVALAEALGFEVRKGNVRKHALADLDYRGDMKSFFSRSYAQRYPDRTAPQQVYDAVYDLLDDIATVAKKGLNGQLPDKAAAHPAKVVRVLKTLAASDVARIAAGVNGKHESFLRSGETRVEAFHKALDDYAGDQTIARSKLVAHLHKVTKEQGARISAAGIEERLRRNTKVRTVPTVLLEAVKGLDDSFRSGLVPIESMSDGADPATWLDRTLNALGFRSKNAMHKALADETGVNYETVHKALTNPRAGQRIRVEIRECLKNWLGRAQRGEALPVVQTAPARRRTGTSVRSVLNQLEKLYDTPEKMYQDAARALSADVDAMRRMHEEGGCASLGGEHVLALKRLLKSRKRHESFHGGVSYLRDRQVRRRVTQLSERVKLAREAWMDKPDDDQLYDRFRRLRLQMIIGVKTGHCGAAMDPIEDPVFEMEYMDVA